jgi:Na+/H+ antiporter NhaD/arsenite permease-like protein
MWINIYSFIMAVIIPSLICLILNIIIFQYVRSSTKRVQPTLTDVNNHQQSRVNRRDLYILRHMIIMFCIFVGGWSPVYLYPMFAIESYNGTLGLVFALVAESSLFLNIIDLYLYNHELRRFLLEKIVGH